MDIHKILDKLPHRYPFLMVDRVLEVEKNVRIRALKNVTINEPFFQGHFPGRPVMPGVMMLEALAQAAALLAFETMGNAADENSVYYFVGIDTPGMTGRPGKCPWKNGSLMGTFFRARMRTVFSTSRTLSTLTKGRRGGS